VVDALNIISFKNKLKHIRETRMGFIWIPAKPYEPHLWLITVEATPGKEPGKETIVDVRWFRPGADWAAWQPGICQVGRLARRPGGPLCQMLK